MNTKSILSSKTFWVQLIAIASSFYPPVGAWVAANPVAAVSALGGLNILVRFVTHGQITIFPGDSPVDGDSGGLGGSALRLLLLVCAAVALLGLPSCATTTAPDGSKTTKPDAESISLAQGIAAWAVTVWQTHEEQKAADKAAERAAKATPVVVIPTK